MAFLLGHGTLVAGDFEKKTYAPDGGGALLYRLHVPDGVDETSPCPLILFFHGAGERGSDNKRQMKHGVWDLLLYARKQRKPVIIIAPQCPAGEQWVNTPWGDLSHTMPEKPSTSMQLVMGLLRQSIKTLPVDEKRIYVTGLSMGGFGVWDIIQRHPEIFAAALAVCGGGDTALAPRLTALPIWAFHGGKDTVVKPARSRDMIAAIKKAGGTPRYTEYKGVGHNAWSRTYRNRDVLAWLLDQKKAGP
jgi:predicted peptidase